MDTRLQEIQTLIDSLLPIEEPYFLVSFKIKPINNIKIFLDGDEGITIEKCVKINRQLYKKIEEFQWYPEGDFSLEVSSPGIDEPLKLKRQYQKNVGRTIEITFLDDTKKEGKLLSVVEEDCIIEETKGKGKKQEITQIAVPLNTVKKAVVQIKF